LRERLTAATTSQPWDVRINDVHVSDGPATKTVRARIIDEDWRVHRVHTTVTVNNVAPSVTPPDVDAPENRGRRRIRSILRHRVIRRRRRE
jgi:hypothetical protein